jgi:quercetin dioxygenase-like cupin family protein
VFRWDDVALERVTAMVSRKVLQSAGQRMTQVYLKRGACVACHQHDWEQVVYVLQGVLQVRSWAWREAPHVDRGVREGELLVVPPGTWHQVEAIDDSFVFVIEPVAVSARAADSPDEAEVAAVV